jgi:hypothetical protein
MNYLLFYTLVILLAIIIVYFVTHWYNHGTIPDAPFQESMEKMRDSIGQTYDSYFTSANDMYERTVGHVNDEAAQMAYDKAQKKERMYARNEKFGRLSDKNLPAATATSFMLADLNRFNIGPNDNNPAQAMQNAAQLYGTALNRIARNPVAIVQTTDPHVPPAEFMVDRAEDFYEDYIARMTLDPAALEQFNAQVPDFNNLRNAIRVARIGAAEHQVNAGNTPKRTKRRRRKGENVTQKMEKQDVYFEERDVRNDPQNVHESQVNNDLARIYNQIKDRNTSESVLFRDEMNDAQTLVDIRNYMTTRDWSNDQHRQRALQTLDKVTEGNWVSKLNARESDVLTEVWRRMNSSQNEDNRDNLRDSLMDSLSDCVETGYNGQDYQVCASGRMGRVLGSLTLLDSDQRIAEPIKTAEILRNEIFAKSYQIIQDGLKGTDAETARAYNGVLDAPAPDVEVKLGEFESGLKNRIETELRDEYEDKVDKNVLDNLINDAQAGV